MPSPAHSPSGPRALRLQGLSIACSTEEALKWDPEWEGSHEISGRQALGSDGACRLAGAGLRLWLGFCGEVTPDAVPPCRAILSIHESTSAANIAAVNGNT